MSPDTSQVLFRHEYEHELETWLRRRFAYLCVTYVVLQAVNLIASFFVRAPASWEATGQPVVMATIAAVGSTLLALGVVGSYYLRRGRFVSRDDMLGAASSMILILGAISLVSHFLIRWQAPAFAGSVINALFFWHFTACLFLPWTPRESLRPIVPLLAVWAVATLFVPGEAGLVSRVLWVMFSPGILIPGLLICGWRLRRHSRRFRSTMLGKHFKSMRQEFTRARRIHESLFPGEYDDGFVRFQYTYEPMRELGGDFVHLHVGAEGLLHLTLLDVTGHGLAAALTVNRIYGELERIRAESPRARPGEVLTLLNRYITLTMARHNIYATAIAMTLDPYLGEIHWASAGHPPVFVRGANCVVRELPATAMVLGATGDDDFDSSEQSMELSPGDVIVAYTDGTFEARDQAGRQLGLHRLRRLLKRPPPSDTWPQFICSCVKRHKVGRAEDDVLVAALTFAAFRSQRQTARPALATR